MNKAIILAAGRGQRLWPLTQDIPKSLLTIGTRTVLEHQLDRLQRVGIEDITIVTGYRAEKIHALVDNRVKWVHNPAYSTTNSLYSFWLARESAREGFILLNADVFFDAEILSRLLHAPYADAVTMEYSTDLGEEEMKIRVAGPRVAAMSKSLQDYHGENLGVVKFSRTGARHLLKTVEAIVAAGKVDVPIPYAFDQFARQHELYVVPSEGLPWIEIDFKADFERANQVIYSSIMGREEISQAA